MPIQTIIRLLALAASRQPTTPPPVTGDALDLGDGDPLDLGDGDPLVL